MVNADLPLYGNSLNAMPPDAENYLPHQQGANYNHLSAIAVLAPACYHRCPLVCSPPQPRYIRSTASSRIFKAWRFHIRGILREQPLVPRLKYPVKKLHDFFECENVWMSDSWWLKESAHDEDELAQLGS